MAEVTARRERATPYLLVVIVLASSFVTLGVAVLPPAVDWDRTYWPATVALLRMETPYQEAFGFYNPPWALLAFVPFVATSDVGRSAVFLVALSSLGLAAYYLGASPVALVLYLTSPPVLHCLLHGNVEWLVLLGLLLPSRWGMFLVLVKPQVAGGVALWWGAEAWREGKWRGVIGLLWPVTLAFLASFVLFGPWPLRAPRLTGLWWNASLWPYSIPLGLAALAWGLWKRDQRGALLASPLLSPYALLHAWSGALMGVVRHTKILAVVWVTLWGLALRAAAGG